MSTKTTRKATVEAVEEIKTDTGNDKVMAPGGPMDEAEKRRRDEQYQAFFAKLPDPCVYCGPSVRGVAQQYTVYQGGIPDALKDFVMEHRAARGLLVSVERFAQVRTRLETPGTREFILFHKVRAELQ